MKKTHAPDLDLDGIADFINKIETPTVEFLELTAIDPDKPTTDNQFVFIEGGAPASRNTVTVLQVDPDLKENEVANFVAGKMDEGLHPICFADVNIPGGAISVVVFRNAGSHGAADNKGFTFTKASVFGLNMDGSPDGEDNGVGSPALGSINTRDPHLVGAAIPIPVAIAQFGALTKVRGNKVEVTNLANNLTITCAIVDFGPDTSPGGPVSKGVALDLTLGAQRALGGNGMISVKYRFV